MVRGANKIIAATKNTPFAAKMNILWCYCGIAVPTEKAKVVAACERKNVVCVVQKSGRCQAMS